MQNVRRKLALRIRELLDLLVMTVCFFLAAYESCCYVRPASFGEFLSLRIRIVNFLIFAIFLLAWHGLFALFGLYRSRRLSSIRREAVDVLKATFAGSFSLLAMGRVSRVSFITMEFVCFFWAASACATMVTRLAVRYFLKALRLRGRNLRHLLIVGTNRRAIAYARKVESKPELGYVIVGFVENGWSDNQEFRQSGYRIVADFEKFREFISGNVVDEVVNCLPIKSHYKQSSEIAKACEQQGIIVRFLSDLFDLDLATPMAEIVDDASVITLRTGAMQGWALLVKRCIDVLLSTIMLLLSSPLFLVTAILIKLTSSGPVFFIQDRVGLNKRIFRLIKFRSMVVDADKMMKELEQLNEVSGPVFKIKNDPRITWVGKYLRKTSIDELPQFINVFRGDMSLVGPRPLPVRDYEGFDEDWQRRRFSVRPGITCLWQVGGRSDISFDHWMKLDMEYIDNWSIVLDIKILMKTIPAVMKGSGAA